MADRGLRPDEAAARNLLHRDVQIEVDESGEEILVIEVRGKRGVGYCKSMPGAVTPYKRLLNRPKPRDDESEDDTDKLPEQSDAVFPSNHIKMFDRILDDTGLKSDREGKTRTRYSLRHSYICFRLMEGADIHQLAKNCRTSVEVIEKYYAAHIKNSINAAAVNVRRQKPSVTRPEPDED